MSGLVNRVDGKPDVDVAQLAEPERSFVIDQERIAGKEYADVPRHGVLEHLPAVPIQQDLAQALQLELGDARHLVDDRAKLIERQIPLFGHA